MNGWVNLEPGAIELAGKMQLTLEWLAVKRGLDPLDGVLFFRAGDAWVMQCRAGVSSFGVGTWAPRTLDRTQAIREAWCDLTGRQQEPEPRAVYQRLTQLEGEASKRVEVRRAEVATHEQLAMLGRR